MTTAYKTVRETTFSCGNRFWFRSLFYSSIQYLLS